MNTIFKNENHSLVLMTQECLVKALDAVFVRAKEAIIAEIDTKPKDEDSLLTKQEVMALLGKSSNTLWKWAKRGYLVPLKVGGTIKYKSEDVRKLMGGGIYGGK